MGTLREDLAQGRELIETHISWVFLEGEHVYKLKKPVNLGFLDFSTAELRRAACEQEVRLNQRLSDDVYHGVVQVRRGADGVHRLGGEGPCVDFAVHMRRLSDRERADVLLAEGSLAPERLEAVARRLAEFHRCAARSAHIDSFGTPDSIRQNVRENFDQTRQLYAQYITREQEREIESAQLDFLDAQTDLLQRRIADGRIRDGHGDLRLEHIYVADEHIDIIDCIEFNERFRYGDVCADLAFLAMDLCHHERTDLAEDLLAAYAQSSGDYDLYALVDFYEGYRAYVRAKVASFLANDESATPVARTAAERVARSYYLHALSAQRRPLTPPVVVAVGGLIASGKSHTSRRVGRRLHCPVIDTDRTRKQLWGVGTEQKLTESAFAGAYSAEASAKVYDEVLRRARVVLESGRSVVLDATFRSRAHRQSVRALAQSLRVPFRFVECHVPEAEAMARLERRAKKASVSDGRQEIYVEFQRSWEPVQNLTPRQHLRLNTTADDASIEMQLEAFCAPD